MIAHLFIGFIIFLTVFYFLLLIVEAFKICCYEHRLEEYNAAYVLLFLTNFRKWWLYRRALHTEIEPSRWYRKFDEHEEDFLWMQQMKTDMDYFIKENL